MADGRWLMAPARQRGLTSPLWGLHLPGSDTLFARRFVERDETGVNDAGELRAGNLKGSHCAIRVQMARGRYDRRLRTVVRCGSR
jgi:hypothetical protein